MGSLVVFKFEELLVYQKAIDFAGVVYKISKGFPDDEKFGLVSQFRRAAVSVSLNIAEGSAKSKKEFVRFIDIALGSLFECVAILTISSKEGYVSSDAADSMRARVVEVGKMLNGLKSSMLR